MGLFYTAPEPTWGHQLGHTQVCISLQTDNHASTPPVSFLQARCRSCLSTNSVKALKAISTEGYAEKCTENNNNDIIQRLVLEESQTIQFVDAKQQMVEPLALPVEYSSRCGNCSWGSTVCSSLLRSCAASLNSSDSLWHCPFYIQHACKLIILNNQNN